MGDLFKICAVACGFIILAVLWWCYGIAKGLGIDTWVVFNVVIGLAAMAGLGTLAAHWIGVLEGFCLWLIGSWICLCKLLAAIAEVNSTNTPARWGESADPAWYGMWWFQWGVGLGLVTLSAYLLMRKLRYRW